MTVTLHYGGTFDPVHAGHLAVAQAAREALDAEVTFLPAADPPHRPAPGASAEQRARMLELAIAGQPGFHVDRREARREGPSYTVDTLRELRAERGAEAPLAWLMGADAFRGLPQWHDWEALFTLAHFVVAVRPGHALDGLPPALDAAAAGRWQRPDAEGTWRRQPAGRVLRLDMDLHPASASELRQRLGAGQGTEAWLPRPVAAYIRDQGLYRAGTGAGGV